ncbi:MAG: EAL and HDOD domain-containing protein [Desulfovibrionaceae bacterium]
MTKTTKAESQYEPIFIARQAIYTPARDIWGYELLFRHSGEAKTAHVTDADTATSKVIADGLSLALTGVPQDKRVLINFPSKLILDDSALALPKERCVVEILETVDPEPNIIAACQRIKDAGYTLALDDYVGQAGFEALVALADIVKVEILGMAKPQLIKLTQQLKKLGRSLLAEKVEDKETFDLCKQLGYQYFQGYFFSKPEVVPGRKIASGALAKLQLLQALNRESSEFSELARIISMDISLSYRLLKFINSAAFSLQRKIQSIDQAVTLLGKEPLRQWAMIVVVSDMDTSPKAGEMAFAAIQRARFLEKLWGNMKKKPQSKEAMFMLGLFSRLDAMLDQRMEDVLEGMPLDDMILDALLGKENAARDCLVLLDAVEQGDWDSVTELLDLYGVDSAQAAIHYIEASTWASQMLGFAKSTKAEGDTAAKA